MNCPQIHNFHNCSHYFIPVIKFERSELSIRIADKMDKIDRSWESFKNPFCNPYRICIRFVVAVVDLYGRVNGTGRFLMRISCSVVYYLIVASLAYYLTRETGNYYASDDLGNAMDIWPPFQYKFVWAVVVFLIFTTISI